MISIITPTYNRAHLLPRMIKSVLAQSFKDWELIIMDDGSTDNTESVVKSFKDSRIKYFFTENSGAGDKRNKGVEKATGDYIIFLDSDDEAKKNWLQAFNDKIIGDDPDLICSGIEKVDSDSGEILELRMPKKLGAFFNNVTGNFLSGSLMIKKSFFQSVDGYDEALTSGQHTDLFLRLINAEEKVRIKTINESFVIVHIHKGARVRNNYEGIYLGSTRTLQKHSKSFKKDIDKHYDYLSVSAHSAFKTGRIKEGKKLLVKALKLKPFYPKTYVRIVVGFIPIVRNRFWKNTKNKE